MLAPPDPDRDDHYGKDCHGGNSQDDQPENGAQLDTFGGAYQQFVNHAGKPTGGNVH